MDQVTAGLTAAEQGDGTLLATLGTVLTRNPDGTWGGGAAAAWRARYGAAD